MRLLEQSSQMLALIAARKNTGRHNEVIYEIEKACLQTIGLPLSLVKRSSPEELLELMKRGSGSYARSVLLAELLIEDAEISEKDGKYSEAICGHLQSFCLLAESLDVLSPDEVAIYGPKLDVLVRKLEKVGDDPYVRQKLEKYFSSKSGTTGLAPN